LAVILLGTIRALSVLAAAGRVRAQVTIDQFRRSRRRGGSLA
jgi:hypothetical protein